MYVVVCAFIGVCLCVVCIADSFFIFCRTILNNIRNPYLLRAQYLLSFLLASFVGGIFWHLSIDLIGTQVRTQLFFFVEISMKFLFRIVLVVCSFWLVC